MPIFRVTYHSTDLCGNTDYKHVGHIEAANQEEALSSLPNNRAFYKYRVEEIEISDPSEIIDYVERKLKTKGDVIFW